MTALTLQSICLLTSETICMKCKSRYRSSQGTMLKLCDASTGATVYAAPKENIFEFDLPHEIKTIQYHVDRCEECFKPSYNNQQSLFEPQRQEIARADRTFALVGQKIGKRELHILKKKAEEDAAQRSNFAKKPAKEKVEKPQFKIEDIF